MLVDLGSVPFAEVLRRASARRYTGDLQVRRGHVVKTLFLDNGALAFAASNLRADRLGEVLVALGRISKDEFSATSRLMQRPEGRLRFGDALAVSGLMDAREVGHSVARQIESIVLSLFPVADGAASFEERPCPIPVEYRVELSLHRLLYEGIRSLSDADRIQVDLGPPETLVQLARISPFTFRLDRCSSEEYAVLEASRRPIPLGTLLEGGQDPFERVRAVYALYASGVLITPEVPHEVVVQSDAGRFAMSQPGRRAAAQAVSTLTPAPGPRATRPPRRTTLAPATPAAEAAGPATRMVRAPLAARRTTFAESAGTTPPPEPAAAPPAPAAPEPVVELEIGLAPPTPPTHGRKPAADDARPAIPGPDARSLQSQADAYIAIADFRQAVRVLARLVELEPDNAAHRLRLAIAMARFPQTAKRAEREFFEAISRAPNDPALHYQFALYYKGVGQRGRAREQLRVTLALDSHHQGARATLKQLAPEDRALTNLRQLFS